MMAKSAPTPFWKRQEAHLTQIKTKGTLLTDTAYSFFSAQFILEGEKKISFSLSDTQKTK